jgi:hypothetical protein
VSLYTLLGITIYCTLGIIAGFIVGLAIYVLYVDVWKRR